MDYLITFAVFLLVFSLVILIHEFGHYFAAKRAGIKVEEFGIGLPPRIFGYKRKGMIWSINAIPFGGFVRMLGEGSDNSKVAKSSKKSYLNKSIGQRMLVITGGVMMNFILAFVLLTFGFIIGIKPLIVSGDDFLAHLRAGNIILAPELRIKEIEADSPAQKAGLKMGDILLKWDKVTPEDPGFWEKQFKQKTTESHELTIERDGRELVFNISVDGKWGITPYNYVVVPVLKISEIKKGGLFFKNGLRPDDIILTINERGIFSPEDYFQVLSQQEGNFNFKVFRNGQEREFKINLNNKEQVIISDVVAASAALQAGLMKNDKIRRIDGQEIFSPMQVINIIRAKAGQEVFYEINRDNKIINFNIKVPEAGMIGIVINKLINYDANEISFYSDTLKASVISIKEVKYSFWQAPFQVWGEMTRLSVLTVKMFGTVMASILGKLEVPQGVAGPVGIAQLTSVFVKEGFASIIRFIAFLSLNLGVVNILPIPALDGGQLAFLIVEKFRGKRIKPSWEAKIHAFGFICLMLLLLFVTYNDIIRLFQGA